MSIEVACQCGKTLKAKDEHLGLKAKCPSCGAIVDIRIATPPRSATSEGVEIPKARSDPPELPGGFRIADLKKALAEDGLVREPETTLGDLLKVLNTIATSIGSSSQKSPSGTNQQREYKVITQKDKWFSGKFDPEKVEGVLNSYAKQGWVMKGVATASVPGFGGQRDEIVIIMER
jgi:Domain of unknown function (DUF4177)